MLYFRDETGKIRAVASGGQQASLDMVNDQKATKKALKLEAGVTAVSPVLTIVK